jgi:hypothetical protein
MKTLERTCIGDWVVILHNDYQHVGTVIDCVAGTNEPKRVRIQRGPLQGAVVMPWQYKLKRFLSETEVDD